MSTLTTGTRPRTEDQHRAAGLRRGALTIALCTGPLSLLITNFVYAMATRDGGSDETGAKALALAAGHTTAMRTAIAMGLIGALLMVPVAMATIRAIGQRSARLAFIGGTLMAAGYICYFGVLLTNPIIVAMAEHGGPTGDFAAVIDAGQTEAVAAWVFPLFALGNLVGTFILGIALLRSRIVPAWAAVCLLAWPPLHIFGLVVVGNEWPAVAGAALQAIGFAVVATRLRRT
jgi:hypothetical protein